MKFLIFTVSCGGGHNQVAKVLKDEIEKNGDTVILFDLFEALHSKFRKFFIEKGFEIAVDKFPILYDLAYNLSDKNKNINILNDLLFAKNSVFVDLLNEQKPDIIISTHSFVTNLFSKISRKHKYNITLLQIVTDFEAHYSYLDPIVDGYIVGSDYTKQKFIENGYDENKIKNYGIPVKDEFRNNQYAKSDTSSNILIMGGSLGSSKIKNIIKYLVEANLNISLTVVCGKNDRLYTKLYKQFYNYISEGNIELYGYTNNISKLMDKAHLLISKPGGITVSEAINKNLPILVPFSYPGQEKSNINFLVDYNLGIKIENLSDLPSKISELLEDPIKYNSLKTNMKNLAKNYSIENIINFAKQLHTNKKARD